MSLALKLETATVKDVALVGGLQAVMDGAAAPRTLVVVVADLAAETLPAASLVQA